MIRKAKLWKSYLNEASKDLENQVFFWYFDISKLKKINSKVTFERESQLQRSQLKEKKLDLEIFGRKIENQKTRLNKRSLTVIMHL